MLLATAIVVASDAPAELYRCQRPDGSTVYTDSQAKCPRSRAHRTSGAVQNLGPSVIRPAPPAAAEPGTVRAASPEVNTEQHWREKRQSAEHEMESAAERRAELMRFVTVCNRGGSLYHQKRNGLRTAVSCDDLKSEVTGLEERSAALQDYLDSGLADECRRAGCLPGWIR